MHPNRHVERLLIDLDALGAQAFPRPSPYPPSTYNESQLGPPKQVLRFDGAKHLLWKSLKFAGCSYQAIRDRLETTQHHPAEVNRFMSCKFLSLDRCQGRIICSEKEMMRYIVPIRDQRPPVASMLHVLGGAVDAWDCLILLPA